MRTVVDRVQPGAPESEFVAQDGMNSLEVEGAKSAERDSPLIGDNHHQDAVVVEQAYRFRRAGEQLELIR